MRRAGWLALALLFAGCAGETAGTDAGVSADAEVPDSGPATIPARQDEVWRSLPTLDRVGRPFVAELLVSDTATVSPSPREAYNARAPLTHFPGGQLHLTVAGSSQPTAAAYVLDAVALFDGLDGRCGVGTLTASTSSVATVRYQELAGVLADDRLWVSTASTCAALFGVERAAYGLGPEGCGGRRPGADALDDMLELLTALPLSDGVDTSSVAVTEQFPFFAAP
jgi:hypothetical protein